MGIINTVSKTSPELVVIGDVPNALDRRPSLVLTATPKLVQKSFSSGVDVVAGLPWHGSSVLQRRSCNIPNVTFYCEPGAALKELYPGIQVGAPQEVNVLTAAETKATLGEQCFTLIVNAKGAENGILECLAEAGAIDQAETIAIHTASTELLGRAERFGRLKTWLVELGYEEIASNANDPDWPVLLFEKNPYRQQLEAARFQLTELKAELTELRRVAKWRARVKMDLEGQIAELTGLLAQAQANSAAPQHTASDGGKSTKPKVIVVGGVPRSGSTWVYNAIRFLLSEAGESVYSTWVKDYDSSQVASFDRTVIKLHDHSDLAFPADLVVTTKREIVERLASLIRMTWLTQNEKEVRSAFEKHQLLYDWWNSKSDIEVDYAVMIDSPTVELFKLSEKLGLRLTETDFSNIANQLDELSIGKQSHYDSTTLVHPNHRGTSEERDRLVAWVTKTLAEE